MKVRVLLIGFFVLWAPFALAGQASKAKHSGQESAAAAPAKPAASAKPVKPGKPGTATPAEKAIRAIRAKAHPKTDSAYASPKRRKMAKQLVEQLGLTVHTVMVDAGHGGKDPGATGVGKLREKNVNLKLAKILSERLKKMGFKVLYTRTTDTFIPLRQRTAMANARHADLFISIHCNAHPNPVFSGLETYSLNLASTPDEVRVAARENSAEPGRISDMQRILDELMHASKLSESSEFAKADHSATLSAIRGARHSVRNRGTHEAPFYVLLGARMPAILVEVGYITNPVEAAKLRDDRYLDQLAKGIADGVQEYKERIERYAQKESPPVKK